jgi:hypothetical protein
VSAVTRNGTAGWLVSAAHFHRRWMENAPDLHQSIMTGTPTGSVRAYSHERWEYISVDAWLPLAQRAEPLYLLQEVGSNGPESRATAPNALTGSQTNTDRCQFGEISQAPYPGVRARDICLPPQA